MAAKKGLSPSRPKRLAAYDFRGEDVFKRLSVLRRGAERCGCAC